MSVLDDFTGPWNTAILVSALKLEALIYVEGWSNILNTVKWILPNL